MGLLFLQGSLRDKHGEVAVLHTQLLDLPVKEFFDGIPDSIRPGPQHVTATDVVILDHLGLGDDLNTAEIDFFLKQLTKLFTQFTKSCEQSVPVSTNQPGFPLFLPPDPAYI